MLYTNQEIEAKLKEFRDFGVFVDFRFFKFSNISKEYDAHFLTAKNTILELQEDKEYQYFPIDFNEQVLQKSGEKISLRDFMGPFFDLELRKPILHGSFPYSYEYFYYDIKEKKSNIIPLTQFKNDKSEYWTQGFMETFLEPPHGTEVGKNKLEIGNYFLSTCDFLFSNLNELTIYKWSVDCSNYFDAGKEWWGSQFWTVYNPTKDYYIGIAASATD
ncbi:hypothetical protein [Pseudotenacibaculum haliotis]|uniref:Uncharacterized protein n=1 Tax=Pseudotenacibaculum haliotis TaxID=1862138 RepID=A0ABW5LVB2_9FLAO